MREIKFRVWDIEFKKMVQWEEIIDNTIAETAYWFAWPDRHIPLEYTGLKDKKGVEIYEGDIVKVYPHEGWPMSDQRTCVSTVVFSEFEGMWVLKDERRLEDCPALFRGGSQRRSDELLEITGNIYDNPELLEREGTKE